MKWFNLFLLSMATIIPVSCSISGGGVDIDPGTEPDCFVPAFGTKGLDKSEFVVSEADIDCYISFKEKIAKKEISVKSIKPVRFGNEVVAYAINYNDCWELISGDRRAPIVLASGKGVFSLNSDNKSFNAWISRICDCVYSLSGMQQLKDIHQKNINHWKIVTEDQNYLRQLAEETRSLTGSHYELVRIDTVDVSEYTDHLVTTHWGQDAPYNMYCPLKSNSNTQRVPAGCVAVAGAQILNYMHNEFEVPETAPTTAICSGHAPNDYSMSQSGFSSSAWNSIANGDSTVIAALIAYVGNTCRTEYTDTCSYAYMDDLRDYVFAPMIWDTVSLDYADDNFDEIVYNLLECDLPSIVDALSLYTYDKHAVIIDGYMHAMIDYYYTINIIEAGQIVGSLDHVERTEPILYFGMNWGWNGLFDDAWYVSTGPWACSTYEFSPLRIITLDEL